MTPDQTPQFQLPQRPVPRPGGSAAGKLAGVLLIAVLALQVYALVRAGAPKPAATSAASAGRIPPDDLKATAMKLESCNLPLAGVEAWQQYLAGTTLEPLEQAKILYRIGKLQSQSEQYQYAVAHLYLAERLAGNRDEGLSRQITLQVRECLQKMGRYSELTREMADRATPSSAPAEGASWAGRQVVAQIGDEKITVADFDRLLQAEIDASINAQAGLSPAQADEYRKQALKQFSDPQAKAQVLQQMVASRVLAAEAKRTQLDQSPDYRERLMAFADRLLASTLMAQAIGQRAGVTPEDAQRYYQTNKDRYAEPAKVILAHIVVGSEAEARDLLARAQAGGDFAELAKQFSSDERTKSDGGRIAQPVTQDAESIPGIGRQAELQSAIWAVAAGSVLNSVYQTDAGWQVVKVLDRTERKDKSYEEVKDQVEQDARAARQYEVTRQYLQELFEQHQVKLYPEAFLPASKPSGATSQP
jgi:peptidyl-prolyl cis-trans isomerase C